MNRLAKGSAAIRDLLSTAIADYNRQNTNKARKNIPYLDLTTDHLKFIFLFIYIDSANQVFYTYTTIQSSYMAGMACQGGLEEGYL